MARIRQNGGASGVRKVSQSMWERAGERAGDGAGALFARLDAQDAQDALDTQELARINATKARETHEAEAETLERLAAHIRAGGWTPAIAALVANAASLLDR